jgi:hypothetical protein
VKSRPECSGIPSELKKPGEASGEVHAQRSFRGLSAFPSRPRCA